MHVVCPLSCVCVFYSDGNDADLAVIAKKMLKQDPVTKTKAFAGNSSLHLAATTVCLTPPLSYRRAPRRLVAPRAERAPLLCSILLLRLSTHRLGQRPEN